MEAKDVARDLRELLPHTPVNKLKAKRDVLGAYSLLDHGNLAVAAVIGGLLSDVEKKALAEWIAAASPKNVELLLAYIGELEAEVQQQKNRIRKLERSRTSWKERAEQHLDPRSQHNEKAQHGRIQELRERVRELEVQLKEKR